MGTLIGLFVGIIFYLFHRWLPTTPSIEIVLTLVTPYCMYYFAEYFHFSGVLAVVSGGLFLSRKRQIMLNYQSRIQGINVWSVLGFVLNGLIFLLIGLQLPSIIRQLGEISLINAIAYGLAISLVLVITRLICTLAASPFTRFMSHFIKVADPNPGWRVPLVLGWAGMRGVVSLAAALSIPILIFKGEPFPYRNLILFITFIVILVTLVIQGLTLPWLIRKIKLKDKKGTMTQHDQELIIHKKITQSSLQFMEEKRHEDWPLNEYLDNLYQRLKIELNVFNQEFEELNSTKNNPLQDYQYIYLELLEHQRSLLEEMNRDADFNEELIRKYALLIDLEEFKIRDKFIPEGDNS